MGRTAKFKLASFVELFNSDAKFRPSELRLDLSLACFVKNAGDRNFSNFAFYAAEVIF